MWSKPHRSNAFSQVPRFNAMGLGLLAQCDSELLVSARKWFQDQFAPFRWSDPSVDLCIHINI